MDWIGRAMIAVIALVFLLAAAGAVVAYVRQ
jgi:hypothetical protein